MNFDIGLPRVSDTPQTSASCEDKPLPPKKRLKPCPATFVHSLPGEREDENPRRELSEIDKSVFSYARLGDTCCSVRTLAEWEVNPALDLLRERIGSWSVQAPPIDPEPRAENMLLDDEQVQWNMRVEDAMDISGCIGVGTGTKVFCAFLDDQPIGLLEVEDKSADHLYIAHFVTHPGSQGAGWRLMAQAVQYSESCGYEGRVHLHPIASARDAYRAMGFMADASLGMVLDPALSGENWQKDRQGFWEHPSR